MNNEQAKAWQEFKDTLWAAIGPPLTRFTEWLNRRLGASPHE